MKGMLTSLCVLSLLGGCAAQSPVFSWYHPEGGEYLFAYDRDKCEAEVTAQGLHLGHNTQGPFFSCMHQRGYYLVDAKGILQVPPNSNQPQVTLQ